MLYLVSMVGVVLLAIIRLTHGHQDHDHLHLVFFDTRAYWMRKAISALAELESPCPFEAFGSVIVNHTDTDADPRGSLVCVGVNQIKTGNPTLHGIHKVGKGFAMKRS